MLTVRVNGPNGDQSIFQAWHVERQDGPSGAMVTFYDSNHKTLRDPVFVGAVYVMNDNGKTVAVYHLGMQQEQQLQKKRTG